jgi:glycosyltransferase involved in cell wall biosynthesis
MNSSKKNVFTIITVVFNAEKTITKTINSILHQTESFFDYIVIDGKSTDNTIELINSYKQQFIEKKINFTLISELDKGIYDAMNKGIDLTTTEYITFLNADDTFDNDFIKSCLKIVDESHPDYIYSSVYACFGETRKLFIPNFDPNTFLFRSMPFPHPGLIVKRIIYNEIGKFDIKYKFAADLDWILKLISFKKYNGFKNNLSLVNYTVGGAGNSMKSLRESINIYNRYNNSLFLCLKLYTIGYLRLIFIKLMHVKYT